MTSAGPFALFRTRFAARFRLRFADLHFRLALVRRAEGAQEGGVAAADRCIFRELIVVFSHFFVGLAKWNGRNHYLADQPKKQGRRVISLLP